MAMGIQSACIDGPDADNPPACTEGGGTGDRALYSHILNAFTRECPPAGSVDEVAGQTYFIAVPVGNEVEFRDCYTTQVGVEAAGLSYFGQVTPTTATREPVGNLSVAVGLIMTALALLILGSYRRPSATHNREGG